MFLYDYKLFTDDNRTTSNKKNDKVEAKNEENDVEDSEEEDIIDNCKFITIY